MAGGLKKYLMLSPVGWKKVWFIVPEKGMVTVDWTFAGLKQQLSRAGARTIYHGLHAMGWRRVV